LRVAAAPRKLAACNSRGGENTASSIAISAALHSRDGLWPVLRLVVQHELDFPVALLGVAGSDETGLTLRAARGDCPGDALHLVERVADSADVAGAFAYREGDANGLCMRRFAKRERFAFAVAPDDFRACKFCRATGRASPCRASRKRSGKFSFLKAGVSPLQNFVLSRRCRHTPAWALMRTMLGERRLARKTVYGTGNHSVCGLCCTQLRARETYREGLPNIRPQSRSGVWAAGCNCELCWCMVMLCFPQACANLREVLREDKCKALNGEKLAVDGFCGGAKCDSRRPSWSRSCAAHAERRSCIRCRGFRMTSG